MSEAAELPEHTESGEAPEPAEAYVRVQGLAKEFAHSGRVIRVLGGIDLEIRRGEMIAIIGPSGAGKSTLLHILGTLDNPTGGRVLFGDVDVFALTPSRVAEFRNRHIGFLFQFHHLLPEFTALENTMMPALIHGTPHLGAAKRAEGLLREVGLADRMKHRPGELSGGEQQRVALARALIMEPPLLLADEPTGNLDSRTSASVHELFFRLNQRFGTTMVLVTHNRELAETMPRVLKLKDGILTERGGHNVRPAEG